MLRSDGGFPPSFAVNLICVKVKIHLIMSLDFKRHMKYKGTLVEVVTTSISDDWLTIFTHDKASIRW